MKDKYPIVRHQGRHILIRDGTKRHYYYGLRSWFKYAVLRRKESL